MPTPRAHQRICHTQMEGARSDGEDEPDNGEDPGQRLQALLGSRYRGYFSKEIMEFLLVFPVIAALSHCRDNDGRTSVK